MGGVTDWEEQPLTHLRGGRRHEVQAGAGGGDLKALGGTGGRHERGWGVLWGPGAMGGTRDSPVGWWGAVGGSPAGQRAALECQRTSGGSPTGWGAVSGCQGMLGDSSTGQGAALGCRGTSGGCPAGGGAAPAPRAAAQPCGPAAPGGCSPRCSRRCPRCAGTAGDSGEVRGELRGGPGSTGAPMATTPSSPTTYNLQDLAVPLSGGAVLGGTRCGAEWDGMGQPPPSSQLGRGPHGEPPP